MFEEESNESTKYGVNAYTWVMPNLLTPTTGIAMIA